MSERKLEDAAKEYARMSYRVFPCDANKKPMTQHGFKDASVDPGEIAAWWEDWPNANIGIATEGVYVVDIDPMDDGSRNPWLDDQPEELAGSPISVTPRGGQHHWFRQPENADLRNSQSALGQKVDARANGGYVVVPPSSVGGQPYTWLRPLVPREQLPEVPAWLLELLRKPAYEPSPAPSRDWLPHEIEDRASKYVASCPEAVSGQRGHSACYAVATYLVHGFCLSVEQALRIMLAEYNPRCQPEWTEKELRHKCEDAERKPHDRPRGWLLNAERRQDVSDLVDLSRLYSKLPKLADDSIQDPGPLPSHLLHVPGFISTLVEHNLKTAIRPQPVLALGAAIALQAVLCARKVMDERGNRTNLYVIGVAESGAGKDHARKLSRQSLSLAGAEKLEGPDEVASDAGVFTAVHACPSILFQFDEFGRFLRTIGDPKKAPHLFNILTVFMKLYSCADTSYKGKSYGDATKNKSINQPCVSIYGTTTPEHFYGSLTAEAISDGFIARLLVFEGEGKPSRLATRAEATTEEILQTVRWWADFRPGGNLGDLNPAPKLLETTPEARAVFESLAERVDQQGGSSLWARCEEKACRLALVYACSQDRENPVINEAAATWACELSEYLTKRLAYLASQWVGDGYFDSLQKRVVRIIKAAGGRLCQDDLSRRTRFLKSRDRRELLENMIENGLIRAEKEETSGRPLTHFYLT